jgi:ATP-dependent Clp protease ATP-binding subunit ClpA
VRVLVEGEGEEKKLAFEYIPAEPKPKAKAKDEDEDDAGEDEEDGPALVEAASRKALPGPKERKEKLKGSGAVPSVPRRKDD